MYIVIAYRLYSRGGGEWARPSRSQGAQWETGAQLAAVVQQADSCCVCGTTGQHGSRGGHWLHLYCIHTMYAARLYCS